MKSIVLLKIRSGQVNEVHNRLRQLQTVLECCMSYGRYDEAAIIQAETLEELWQIIASQIKPICWCRRDISLLDRRRQVSKEPAGARERVRNDQQLIKVQRDHGMSLFKS